MPASSRENELMWASAPTKYELIINYLRSGSAVGGGEV